MRSDLFDTKRKEIKTVKKSLKLFVNHPSRCVTFIIEIIINRYRKGFIMKRSVEIFTAGCPVCNPVVQLVKETSCESCEITIYDLVEQCEEQVCLDKMKEYGIKRIPSVVVNGRLLDCCNNEITADDLTKAGIGQSL